MSLPRFRACPFCAFACNSKGRLHAHIAAAHRTAPGANGANGAAKSPAWKWKPA